MRAGKARWRPNVFAGFLLCYSWLCSCSEQITVPNVPLKLLKGHAEELSVWPSKDFDFDWVTLHEALIIAKEQDRPLLYYIAAPGCDGLFENPSLFLRALIEKKFVSVRINPFVYPEWVDRLSAIGCPALINALPDGRVFSRATDIPKNNVEPYLLRMHNVFKKEKNRLLTKVNQETKEVPRKYSTKELLEYFMASFDMENKGLFGPQKFSHATALRFLYRTGNSKAIEFVEETVDVLVASPLWEDGSFRLFSYSPDWNHPSPERDVIDQVEIVDLLIALERWVLVEKWVAYVKDSLTNNTDGALYGRQLLSNDGKWWTDPNIYVDRMASLILRLIEISEKRNNPLAHKLASEGIKYLLNECVDQSGGVRHVCNGPGSVQLSTDQTLVALTLSAWSNASHDKSLSQLAEKILKIGIKKKHTEIDDMGLVYAAYWYWNYGDKTRAEQLINWATYNNGEIRQAALWGLLDLRYGELNW